MLFLWLDLENRWNAFRFYLAFRPTSPMSWGAWILVLIYPVSLLFAWTASPEPLRAAVLRRAPRLRRLAARADARARVLALATTALLGAGARRLHRASCSAPWWPAHSGTPPSSGPLFLVSGLSTGAAFMLLARLDDRSGACWAASTWA